MITLATTAREKPVIRALPAALEPNDQAFACWLGDFERNGSTGLLLDHGRPVTKRAAGRNVAHLELYKVAASELGVDRAVEKRQVAGTPRRLQLVTDRPDVLRLQWRLRADHPAGVPGTRWDAKEI